MADVEKAHEIQAEHSRTPDNASDDHKITQVDTVHQDEAMKVLAGYTGEETWTEQEEKQVRRKIDLRLMPVLCITYGLQYYDKAMLSQAVRMIVIFNTSLWLTTKGIVWFTHGFASHSGQSLLLFRSHILPWVNHDHPTAFSQAPNMSK